MLSDDERMRIEADAAVQVRAQWGHVNPRALDDVLAEIKTRMQEGTWGQQTFAEQIDALARLTHAGDVFSKDDAAIEEAELSRNELELE